jgi:hypothetical protein
MPTRHDIRYLDVATLATGGSLRIGVHELVGGDGPTVAIVGTVHGDEPLAAEVVRRIVQRLVDDELMGTVLAVPVMNPLAFESYTRHTPIDGMNLNRVFPGRQRGSVSDQMAFALQKQVLERADALIDLHTGSYQFTCDYAYAIGSPDFARHFGSAAVITRPAIPGSSAQQLVDRGKVAVIAEFGGGGHRDDAVAEEAVEGALNSLRALGVLAGSATTARDTTVTERMSLMRPTRAGLVEPGVTAADLGRVVDGGTLLGTIVDPVTFEPLERFEAPFAKSKVTLVGASFVRMNPGDFAYMVVDADVGDA